MESKEPSPTVWNQKWGFYIYVLFALSVYFVATLYRPERNDVYSHIDKSPSLERYIEI